MNQDVRNFLRESNKIEKVGEEGLEDSVSAFSYLMQITTPIRQEHILKVHKIMLKNLDARIAGYIREDLVTIAGRLCPKSDEIPVLMEKFLEQVNDIDMKKALTDFDKTVGGKFRSDIKPIDNYCKLVHVTFEKMHPFEDGNGRVGRMLLNWHRKKMGLPLLTIKFSERWDYYNWFL